MPEINFVSMLFGFLGISANVIIFWQKDRRKLLTVKLLADILWTIHYGTLYAWSGAAVCAIGILRETVFINDQRKWAKSQVWLAVFIVCAVISAAFTWNGLRSILPAAASITSIISFKIGVPHLTRCLQIPISVFFLIYDVLCFSHIGVINEIMILISVVFLLSKHHLHHKV